MDWVAYSGQLLLFLKLDFSKAYAMVDHGFLSQAMLTMGFPSSFVDITMLLFQDANATVKINGSLSPSFPIIRGVRQGCPLAPYLFLIITEVLKSVIKTSVIRGEIKGISLLIGDRQQIMAQYANDTLLTLLGEEGFVVNTLAILDSFCRGSGLILNWDKSCGYWQSQGAEEQPTWTHQLQLK